MQVMDLPMIVSCLPDTRLELLPRAELDRPAALQLTATFKFDIRTQTYSTDHRCPRQQRFLSILDLGRSIQEFQLQPFDYNCL